MGLLTEDSDFQFGVVLSTGVLGVDLVNTAVKTLGLQDAELGAVINVIDAQLITSAKFL